MRLLLSSVLRHHGFQVIEADSGSGCLGRLAALLPRPTGGTIVDLIVVDLRGPWINGLDLLGRLRRVDWATPVILISAFDDPATHQEAARLGAAAVMGRPFDLDDLLTAVFYWT